MSEQSSLSPTSIPFYRQYWVFGMLFLLLPVAGAVLCGAIILSGEVYKQKKGGLTPASELEKATIVVVGLFVQAVILIGFWL